MQLCESTIRLSHVMKQLHRMNFGVDGWVNLEKSHPLICRMLARDSAVDNQMYSLTVAAKSIPANSMMDVVNGFS